MTVVLVDYGAGNLRSAAKALERAARENGHGAAIAVSGDPDAVRRADRVVLPGVGAYGDCRRGLAAVDGLVDALTEAVETDAKPFLGICVGMQLMTAVGREHGEHPGFGWVGGAVEALRPADPNLKIPHMGWNELELSDAARDHPVLAGLCDGDHAYFVHSYAVMDGAADERLATVDYGGPVTAIVGKANAVGTQFHPEKSQATGLRLLANFLDWQP